METFGGGVAALGGEEDAEEEERGKVEALPPLLEDEENVSLADILCLRDSCLSEQEVWAVCAECVRSLQSISCSPLFYTLCITPDTLAFNAHGNVCFMEQLSDDPEGSFVPPEFDKTGNTFEGHVFSLGSTLSAALGYDIEPETEAVLGVDTCRLLEQMQEEKPGDRPCPQVILSLAEAKITDTTSRAVCRKLSAIGRRVLSIESVAPFQDEWDKSYHFMAYKGSRTSSVENHTYDQRMSRHYSSDSHDDDEHLVKQRRRVCNGSFRSGSVDGYHGGPMSLRDVNSSQNGSPVLKMNQEVRWRRSRSALNRSCSIPDSNNPPVFSSPSHTNLSMMVADLSEIGGEESMMMQWEDRMLKETHKMSAQDEDAGGTEEVLSHSIETVNRISNGTPTHVSIDAAPDYTGQSEVVRDEAPVLSTCVEEEIKNSNLCCSNHMAKSMLCLNEESQDEWVSLRELLSHCTQPLSVNELWALCYTCLSTLQTYTDFPAYLCLDSVYVGCDGELLFLVPKNTGLLPFLSSFVGSNDVFYVAPEFQEHGILTEKACIYGVAAILWATAKFHLSPNQKLAMPRKLKRLLLEMAKKTPIERPSIVMAKKSCHDYLTLQGTDVETVWTQLINRLHKASNRFNEEESFLDVGSFKSTATPERKTGFIPLGHDVRLAPVSGPLPQSDSLSMTARLPEAFTSLATHFTPIVVAQEDVKEEESPIPQPRIGSIPSEIGIGNEDLTSETPQLQQNWTQGEQEEDLCSSLSSSTTVLTSSPHSNLQTACPESNSQSLPDYPNVSCSTGIYNNFLLQQDPQSGRLTLFPVHIAVSQPITGLDLSVPLRADSETDSGTQNTEHDVHHVTKNGEPDHHFTSSYHKNSKGNMPNNRAHLNIPEQPQHTRVLSTIRQRHPVLQQVIGLIREEFAFDCYLENGAEELVMGEYILSLTSLHFETFCRAIVEKFSDLHWDKDLLGLLHCLVNHDSSFRASVEDPSSELEERALTPVPDAKRCEGVEGGNTEHGHNANKCHAPEEREHKATRQQNHGETKDKQGHIRTEDRTADEIRNVQKETQPVTFKKHHLNDNTVLSGLSMDLESSSSPVDGAEVCVSTDESLCQHSELKESTETQLSLDCSDAEMDDSDSVISDRTVSSYSGFQGPLSRPAWALALYGEVFFSQEVVEYAYKLGSHTDSPSLEDKSQELQQQLMIESRNLKKTRNFYHKLIQQERKNKGSEAKVMLSKLRAQFDELRTKIEFLDSVRQYLQVLYVDQWGLPLSLLPSLASSGSSTEGLRASEDPAILSLMCEQRRTRGCCPLLAGTPKGLMTYLYARNALVEGYIQHFLYTYRYFCTPEEFLQFLMDKFNSSVVAKVYHRTLDLLECWIEDSRSVDFTSNSCLQPTLNKFLTSEVTPVDSRGESLLTMLQNSPKKRRTCGVSIRGESPISGWDDLDVQSVQSFCRRSSVDDAARKSFQWRVSRVVEPQVGQPKEKVYSIASALPRPCYSSLLSQLTNVSVRNEERVAFSHTEHSPLNTAQQLTLLQQEIFQGCHPVHFLNSRAQGVKEKAVSISKCLSSDPPPLEGSSLFVGDEPGRDGPLQHLLRYAESISNWVSAEIVITDSVKVQTALLGKFLTIAKHCYEARNFATAMQILGGLENVIVRQLPAWKQLSAKMSDVLEEIRAVQVFLKSDSLCLMEGERGRRQPTLPDAHILAMHIQQLEIGAFTLTNKAYKWTKLRTIARVVSQVHAFQEHTYTYTPDLELQAYLQARINRLGACDVSLLAADNEANFNQPAAERHTRRIQDTLRRVKASFQ
ncbi:kinase non-catalytic C-lobe domain-containing protein 1 isoform X2 [Ictalurus furcatus]|uniref:kinase non-catalytic C-lobe domain-containing protein 1 isoform X2 n=1 Tax=Ictalurus furcatus TaxID=66913 RepID=UPI0023507E6E|nr:kinase non-catalytic C-lobe domain-containing protein 1 isoform X2 [Ictalurus furcatus]